MRSEGIGWGHWSLLVVSWGMKPAPPESMRTRRSSKQRKRHTPSDMARGNEGTDGGRVIVGLRWIRREGSREMSFDSETL